MDPVSTPEATAAPGADAYAARLRPVRIWLYVMAALVLLMVVVGGATRLTNSGLSIVEWKLIHGVIPPLSDADWQQEFEAYQQIPQFAAQHFWMTVNDFKGIFWWEWAHRLLGRILGLAFAIPFVVFLIQRRFSRDLAWPLAGLFVLGGFQGVLGWWMVSSGLTQLTSVSQYRLAAHLFAAAVLFIALIWVARRLPSPRTRPYPEPIHIAPVYPRWPAAILLLLVLLQIVAGAFVAGLDAGLSYNTWPLMQGAIVPAGLDVLQPFWRNLFENDLTVQFIHRTIAYVIVAWTIFMLWRQSSERAGSLRGVHGWLPRLALLVLLQVVLGIGTLVMQVPLSLALGHQALAFMLAGAVTGYLADLTPRRT
jgi:cytochrome c oxidase assembly protein subunit 15